MRSLPVAFSTRAEGQLDDLFQYIERIRDESLRRHTSRGSSRSALVSATFRSAERDVTIFDPACERSVFAGERLSFFTVRSDRVVILGIFYGGQDFEAAFREELE